MLRSALMHSGRRPARGLAPPPPPPPALRPRPSPRCLSSAVAEAVPSEASPAEEAVEKARQLFAEYRDTHYRQCLPSRFRKEVMRAAVTDPARADRIDMEGLRRVFANIGARDRISDHEVRLIFEALGNDAGEIDVPRFKRLVCP